VWPSTGVGTAHAEAGEGAVGGNAVAHDLRGGWRRAVSGGRLGLGHGGAAAYPGSDEGNGGVARSDKCGRKWSFSFGHGLSGQRYRESHGLSGRGGGRQNADMARPDGAHAGAGAWQPCGDGVLTSEPSVGSSG
jgi:hypothetical protein